jgi:hypothetical protein
MKSNSINSLGMVLLITYSVSSCGPSTNDALDYFDKIIAFQEAVIEKEEALQDAVFELIEEDSVTTQTVSPENEQQLLEHLELAHSALINIIDSSLQSLRQMESFSNSYLLRDAAQNLLVTYKEVALNEYITIIKLLRKPANEFSESDNTYFNELWVRTINLKLNKAIDDFTQAQFEYAKLWNFDLDDERLIFHE